MRFLVLDQGLLARDCADELGMAGHNVFLADPQSELFAGELERAEALLSINLHARLAAEARRRHVPYLAWIVDPLVNRAKLADDAKEASPDCRIYSYDRAQVEIYRGLGFARVEHLPTAAAPLFCEEPEEAVPGEEKREDLPVSFVGTPLVERTNEFASYRRQLEAMIARGKDEKGYFRKLLRIADACIAEQAGELSRFLIPDRFTALEREEGIEVISRDWSPEKWQLVLSMSKDAARAHRVGVCRALAPLDLTVWGPPDWTQALAPGMTYGGPVEYPAGALQVYRRSAVNLNVTRIYAGDVVANRVWDVLACGGFLLTDWRPELELYLKPGEDLVCYRSVEEARTLAERYLEDEEGRRRIAASGRAKVLARHTLRHRVARMLRDLAG